MDSLSSSTSPRLQGGIILFCIFFLFCSLGASVSVAFASNSATFSWRANPQDDNIISYRLYYGSSSRFDNVGQLKSGFSYDYYLDFANGQRCRITKSGAVCEQYEENEVSCEGLTTEMPKCMLYGLHGRKYFAMTAYNAQEESSYTKELKASFGAVAPKEVVGLLYVIYQILLR